MCHRKLTTLRFLEIAKLCFILSSFLLPNLFCHKATWISNVNCEKYSGGCGPILLSKLNRNICALSVWMNFSLFACFELINKVVLFLLVLNLSPRIIFLSFCPCLVLLFIIVLLRFIKRNNSVLFSCFWRYYCFVLYERCCTEWSCTEWSCSFAQCPCWKNQSVSVWPSSSVTCV